MSSNSDTRHIIRPEHFALAPQLLGMELARPSRRLTAILVDLMLVAILVKMAGGALLALAAAYAFFRFASRSGMGQSTRLVVRLAGALILFLVIKRGVGATQELAVGMFTDAAPRVATASAAGAAPRPQPAKGREPGLGDAVRVTSGIVALRRAENEDQARSIATGLVAGLREAGVDEDGIQAALEGAADKSDKPWMDEVVRDALPKPASPVPAESLAVHYAAALTAGDSARADSLRPRVAAALASDTVTKLGRKVKSLREENSTLEQQVEEAKSAEKEGPGLLATLKHFMEDLGLGFGWTGLYFTAFTLLWRGQTPGKRLLGVRVLRLDGKPLTLWTSFERFGGYAAGLVTGLLGFAQVFWDRNRQAIHDKISETVVVRERATPVPPTPPPPGPPLPDRRAP
jgi:hypothetical protein